MITAEDFMRYSMGKTNRPAMYLIDMNGTKRQIPKEVPELTDDLVGHAAFKYEIMNPMTLEMKVKADPASRRLFLRMAKRINRQRRLAKVKKKWAENAARHAYFNLVLDSVDAGERKRFRLFINKTVQALYWDEEKGANNGAQTDQATHSQEMP